MKSNKLSTKEYWDSVLKNYKLPRINSPKQYNYYVTMKYIDSILSAANKRTFLEIGCGSSGWLPYFAKKYNYLVSGLDYSEIGCQIAKENLKMFGITCDEIICEDILQWKSNKRYDVIFTYGVIEHFKDPGIVLKIIYEHLNSEGIAITVVPNLQGIIRVLFKLFAKDIYDTHIVISKGILKEIHEKIGFQNIKTDYVGTLFLHLIPWSRSQNWLFREKSFQRKISLKVINLTYYLISFPLRKLNLEIRSSCFSPYIISIMKKNNAF